MNEPGITSVGVEPCPKHTNYKGRRPTKRDCPQCQALYKAIQVKTREQKPFRSLFSPDFRVSMFHLLAEIACYQRFGRLPPYFWRKGVQADPRAKAHYNKVYKMLMAWKKKQIPAKGGKWNPVEAMNQVFYYLALHDRDIDEMRVKKTKIVKEEKKSRRTTDTPIDFGASTKRSKFQGLKDLGDDDGEE